MHPDRPINDVDLEAEAARAAFNYSHVVALLRDTGHALAELYLAYGWAACSAAICESQSSDIFSELLRRANADISRQDPPGAAGPYSPREAATVRELDTHTRSGARQMPS
jgi:hypothetical protein